MAASHTAVPHRTQTPSQVLKHSHFTANLNTFIQGAASVCTVGVRYMHKRPRGDGDVVRRRRCKGTAGPHDPQVLPGDASAAVIAAALLRDGHAIIDGFLSDSDNDAVHQSVCTLRGGGSLRAGHTAAAVAACVVVVYGYRPSFGHRCDVCGARLPTAYGHYCTNTVFRRIPRGRNR